MQKLTALAVLFACALCAVPAITAERVEEVLASGGVRYRHHADGRIEALVPGADPLLIAKSSDTRRILVLGDRLFVLKSDGRLLEHQHSGWRVHGWKRVL